MPVRIGDMNPEGSRTTAPGENAPGAAMPLPAGAGGSSWDNREWDELIGSIQMHAVVPVIGPELMTVEVDGRTRPLYTHVSELLAGRLGVKPPQEGAVGLHQIVSEFIESDPERHTTGDALKALYAIMGTLSPKPSPALMHLAEVRGFKLFIATTPDGLLEQAINTVRFRGRSGVVPLVFSPNVGKDLPGEYDQLDDAVVFYPFGSLASWRQGCVISDEDLLEFFYCLQSKAQADLPRLSYALGENQLLFLGDSFPDWVLRFFLRTGRRTRLSKKDQRDYIVGEHLTGDSNLVRFLRLFTKDTRVPAGNAITFVRELRDRWMAANPAPPDSGFADPPSQAPKEAVFLSYAGEDRDAVRRIRDGLESDAVEVWFDKDQLMAGDNWESKIGVNLQRSACFIPVISRTTEEQVRNRYFREEWMQAREIMRRSHDEDVFVLPVTIDDITPTKVPQEFLSRNWTHLPGGAVTADFRRIVADLVASRRKKGHG